MARLAGRAGSEAAVLAGPRAADELVYYGMVVGGVYLLSWSCGFSGEVFLEGEGGIMIWVMLGLLLGDDAGRHADPACIALISFIGIAAEPAW